MFYISSYVPVVFYLHMPMCLGLNGTREYHVAEAGRSSASILFIRSHLLFQFLSILAEIKTAVKKETKHSHSMNQAL